MAMTIEWEWMTDDLRWKPYIAACSATIEAAYNAGESSVNLCIQSTSGFTHSITFKAQPPVQGKPHFPFLFLHVSSSWTQQPSQKSSTEE
jgi:hypothetical protein